MGTPHFGMTGAPPYLPMKNFLLLVAGLAFTSALLGFGFFAGVTATVFRFLFLALFVLAGIGMLCRPKVIKPVPSSFAASFPSEPKPGSERSSL